MFHKQSLLITLALKMFYPKYSLQPCHVRRHALLFHLACLWVSFTYILVLGKHFLFFFIYLTTAAGQRYLNVSHSFTQRQKVAQAVHVGELVQEGT